MSRLGTTGCRVPVGLALATSLAVGAAHPPLGGAVADGQPIHGLMSQGIARGLARTHAQDETDPSAAPGPQQKDVLYQADWSQGLGNWVGSRDWTTVDGMLVNDGSRQLDESFAIAPYRVPVADHAVEAEMRMQLFTSWPYSGANVGVVLRRGQGGAGGYGAYAGNFGRGDRAGIHAFKGGLPYAIDSTSFYHNQTWNTYRFEAKGSVPQLFINGVPYFEIIDTTYPSGPQVGVWTMTNTRIRIDVRSFKVIAL